MPSPVVENREEMIEKSSAEGGTSSTVFARRKSDENNVLPDISHLEKATTALDISKEHENYLLARYGTLDLDPLPSMDPLDPLNWPDWRKSVNLYLVSFQALMTTFIAAAVIPAFSTFAEELNITLTQASYLTSIQILILGFSPLLWIPISNRYGRRPVWIISTLGSMIGNIGSAESHSYASQVVTRVIVAFFISPAIALGSSVVTEIFFKRERAQKMGIWTLMVTLGPPGGPFIMGFVAYHTGGWQWIYWVLAITNGVQCVLYFFFSPETRFMRDSQLAAVPQGSQFKRKYLHFTRIDKTPLTLREFLFPFHFFAYPNIVIPSVAYSIVFGFTSVLLTVEIPQIFTPKFGFNAQQIGLQFIGMIVGSVLGEQIGGRGSDFFMRRFGTKSKSAHESRLWIAYPGFITAIVGLIVFCVQVDRLKSYNVTPIVGIAIAAFGNQIITTVLITYAVDCYIEHAGSIGIFVSLVRNTWGFIGPFWFPNMFDSLGLTRSGGLMIGIIVAVSVLPTIFLQWKGRTIREKRAGVQ